MTRHSLALVGHGGVIDVARPVRLVCMCGHVTEPLATADAVEGAALAHMIDVETTDFAVFAERDHVERDR